MLTLQTQPNTVLDRVTLRSITEAELDIESMLDRAYADTEFSGDANPEERAEALAARQNIEEALFEYLVASEAAGNSKVESYVAVIKRLEAQQAARKLEADRVARLATIDGNKVKSLKERLAYYMNETHRPKIETGLYKLSLCGNGGKLALVVDQEYLDDPEQLPTCYQKQIVVVNNETLRPDAEAYKAALDAYRTADLALSECPEDDPEFNALIARCDQLREAAQALPACGIATIAERGKHVRIS